MRLNITERLDLALRQLEVRKAGLARIAEVSKAAVGQWFNEGVIPGEKAADNIQRKTGLSAKWLRHGTGPMFVSDDTMLVHLVDERLSSLSPEDSAKLKSQLLEVVSKHL